MRLQRLTRSRLLLAGGLVVMLGAVGISIWRPMGTVIGGRAGVALIDGGLAVIVLHNGLPGLALLRDVHAKHSYATTRQLPNGLTTRVFPVSSARLGWDVPLVSVRPLNSPGVSSVVPIQMPATLLPSWRTADKVGLLAKAAHVGTVPPLLLFPLLLLALLCVVLRRRRAGHCPACGYDLRASPLRCPECGAVAAPAAPAAAANPPAPPSSPKLLA